MQISNNYQSPNFGMALRISSKEGLMKYVANVPERIEEVAELGARLRKADKAHMRKIDKVLKEAGLTVADFPVITVGEDFANYVPEVNILEDGRIALKERTWADTTIYDHLRLSEPEVIKKIDGMYDNALKELRAYISFMLRNKAKHAQEDRIDKGIDSLMNIYG